MKNLFRILLVLLAVFMFGCFEGGGGGGGSDSSDNNNYTAPSDDTTPAPAPVVTDYVPTYPNYREDMMIRPPHADYNKNWQNDTNMCWAVATCDAVTNAGYSFDASICMSYMTDRFADTPGYAYDAIMFWFEDVLAMSYVPAWQGVEPTEAIDDVLESLDAGNPVILLMTSTRGPIGHAITVYGYEHLAYGEADGFMYVFKVADGDDRYSGVVEWGFYWNDDTGRWECYDRDFALSHMYSIVPSQGVRGMTNYAPITRGPHPTGKILY